MHPCSGLSPASTPSAHDHSQKAKNPLDGLRPHYFTTQDEYEEYF